MSVSFCRNVLFVLFFNTKNESPAYVYELSITREVKNNRDFSASSSPANMSNRPIPSRRPNRGHFRKNVKKDISVFLSRLEKRVA